MLSFISHVTLDKLLNLFEPQVSKLKVEIIIHLDFYENGMGWFM